MTVLSTNIFKLREQGYSYTKIQQELNCSKGTLCYYLGKNQKQKNQSRMRKYRLKLHPFVKKIEQFNHCQSIISIKEQKKLYLTNKLIQYKIYSFHRLRIHKGNRPYMTTTFTIDDVIQKFGDNPKCSLTGDIIDIYQPRTYEFDHIIPSSRGGDNSLSNLQILTKEANRAKQNLTDNEFLQLCLKIVKHHGYTCER